MKRFGNLYEKVYDLDNLKLAHKHAKRGKSHYKEVLHVDNNEDELLKELQLSLKNKTYITSDYDIFERCEYTKTRIIYKLHYYPDRIAQWALLQVIEPYLLRRLSEDTYSAIPNRGIHKCLNKLTKELRCDEELQYCFKMDIKKYYPSINHTILKQEYSKIFKDNDLLWLIYEIIDSVEMSEDTGIPIGNYLSQWSANLYLTAFDRWVKETLKVKHYYRYMDDIVVLGKSKEELHFIKDEIFKYLDGIKLSAKSNYQIFPIEKRGIDFVGYRVFRNFILLRKSISKKYKRKMLDIKKLNISSDKSKRSIASYNGWLKWCNSYNLKQKYMILRKVT